MARSISVEQRRWRAQDDARILADAEEIRVDKKRMSSAVREAKNMVTEKQKALNSIKKVAKRTTKKTSRKK
ncbi:hypothetical protein HOD41_07395 [bacterium]|jgi:hypothetical protein|nr:hypothetical protein [bacterium]